MSIFHSMVSQFKPNVWSDPAHFAIKVLVSFFLRTMVEIKPYIDDDDEDQSNWVPLTSSSKPTSNKSVGNVASDAPAAADETYANQKTCGAVNSDLKHNSNMNQHDNVPRTYVSKGSQDSLVLLENIHDVSEGEEEDDDCGWQKISSSPPLQHQSSTTDAPNKEESWSWSKQLITHLTTTQAPTTATSSAPLVVEDVASDDDGDNNIVWQKPNKLEDDAVEKSRRRRHEIETKNVIEQEYDDVPNAKPKRIVRQQESKEQPLQHNNQAPQVVDDDDTPWERYKQNEKEKPKTSAPPPRFQHIPSQRRQQQSHNQRTNDDDPPSVKTKLQQTFIHDPLCALPFCFLKHLYYETKLQLTQTWDMYFEHNELQSVLAPLVLIVLIGMFGIALVGSGLYQLGMLVAKSGMHALLSFGKWMIGYALTMGYQILWSSLYSCVVLGLGVWVWSKARKIPTTTEEMTDKKASNTWKVPSISTIVPWTIALSSPALYEAVIIILSLRTILPILTQSGTGFESCDAEEEPYCLADGNQQSTSHGMSSIAVSVVVLLLAAINVYVVSVAAKMMDEKARSQTKVLEESSLESSTEEANNSSSSSYISRLHKNYELIQRHAGICHTISIITLAITSVLLLLVQTLYIHYQQEGGRNVLVTLVNQMGTVGFNTVCIGLGIFVLVTLWNITINAITTSDTIIRVSFGQISRSALKKAVIEISSNAVWSSDDTGSSLLGILSDDDGALRLAILEWIIERWTASSNLSSEEESDAASSTNQDATPTPTRGDNDNNHDSSRSNNSHGNISSDSTENIDQSGNNSGDSSGTNNDTPHEPVALPSYQSLQGLIAKLDADETLIPTIERYRAWVYSLPPSRNAATCVALWKMCPAIAILMLSLGFSLLGGLLTLLLSCMGASSASNSRFGFGLLICTVLSPLICLEYIRVSRWWMKTTSHLKKLEYDTQSNHEQMQRDLVMILLRADAVDDDDQPVINVNLLFDTSSFLLRIWFLLLESISVLESSIPVVRCATVASAAADLTTNTICLVDLALEVKKRGLIGGAGVLIWDAFQHHLSKELKQRKQETYGTSSDQARGSSETDDAEEEELGGQYTGAVMSAVGNVGKISHNVSCLVKSGSRNENDVVEGNDAQGESSHREDPAEPPHPADKEDKTPSTPENVKEAPSPTTIDQDEEEISVQEKSCEHGNDDNGGLMPFLVGGGIALVGAVAGIAVHAATNNNGQEQDKRRKKDK